MKKRDLLRIYIDKDGKPVAKLGDMNIAAITAAGLIKQAIGRGDFDPMNLLIAITANILASEHSGNLEKRYIENLQRATANIRKSCSWEKQ